MSGNKTIILIILLAALGLWWALTHGPSEPEAPEFTQEEVVEDEVPEAPVKKSPPSATVEEPPPEIPEATEPSLEGNFAKALSGLPSCLQSDSEILPTTGEPTIDNWTDILRSELGDIVFRSEAWSNTHISLPTGENRRVHLEVELTDDDRVVRKLRYESIDDQGQATPIPLAPEQSEDPSETFLASLEKEGDVTLTEKAERFYFQDGSEAFAVHRNGVVAEIEINKSGASYRCWNLDQADGNCECL